MTKQSLYVVLPSYNEQENIESLIERWLSLSGKLNARGYSLKLCPVDDGSRDHTRTIIERMAARDARVKPLFHPVNLGLGAGLNTGLSYFMEASAENDVVVVMDADNTHEPSYVFPMLDAIKAGTIDLVIASRYVVQSSIVGVPKFRLFLSEGARFFYTFLFGVTGVRDYTCGYRLYTRAILEKGYLAYGDALITESSFACMMELLYKLSRVGARFLEVPFTLRYDQKGGSSKMRVIRTMLCSIKTAFHLRFSRSIVPD